MSISAMKQALEALDSDDPSIQLRAAVALRQAIAEAEKQEPVAWMTHTNDLMPLFHMARESALNWETQPTPLYPAPPKREWVGLTGEEIMEMTCHEGLIRYFEAKLKEKNT